MRAGSPPPKVGIDNKPGDFEYVQAAHGVTQSGAAASPLPFTQIQERAMNEPVKQHLIDPEVCIRCYTCEPACPIGAIEHDGTNVVVKAEACNFCMSCIPVCPTGSIDEWRVVATPYTLAEQYGWSELPAQAALNGAGAATEAFDEGVAALLAQAHEGAGGKSKRAGERLEADASISTRWPSPSRRRCRAITA